MNTNKKTILAIVIGNALEYYDFMLYGLFAAILAPLFFPHHNPTLTLLGSMGSYGVGFLARPLGGIFFGHLGDRWGRKDTFSLSLLLIAFPTLCIGLLPTYDKIGIWAPTLLIVCRLLHGFCLGGETSGAMTYIVENAPASGKDKASAWLVTSCYGGTVFGTLLGSLFTLPSMPTWGWRLTFIVGSFIALVGYYVRRKLNESSEFLTTQKKGEILTFPLKNLIKQEKLNLLCAAGLASGVVVPFFVIFIYLNGLLTRELHLEPSQVLLLNAGLMLGWTFVLPGMGSLAQRYGREKIMRIGALGVIFSAFPVFLTIGAAPTLPSVLISQLLLSIFASAYAAPTSSFLVDLFPTNKRYSGIALGYSLGHALFGGLTPVFLTLCVQSFHFYLAPAVFLVGGSFLGLLPLLKRYFVKELTILHRF